jgi:probable rRNA maturation factor
MKIIIEISKDAKAWDAHKNLTSKVFIKKVLSNVLSRFPNFNLIKEFELSILLTSSNEMQRLNREFRDKDRPTNVLSFPDIELNWQHLLEFKPDLNYMYLGDIAFGYEVINFEAINQNKTFNNHFTHLLVHSILHLIGFDHQNEVEELAMEELEVKILKDFAIDSPY